MVELTYVANITAGIAALRPELLDCAAYGADTCFAHMSLNCRASISSYLRSKHVDPMKHTRELYKWFMRKYWTGGTTDLGLPVVNGDKLLGDYAIPGCRGIVHVKIHEGGFRFSQYQFVSHFWPYAPASDRVINGDKYHLSRWYKLPCDLILSQYVCNGKALCILSNGYSDREVAFVYNMDGHHTRAEAKYGQNYVILVNDFGKVVKFRTLKNVRLLSSRTDKCLICAVKYGLV